MNRILIVAGETSGDIHGGKLIREILSIKPDVQITGVGGPQMQAAGMETIFSIENFAFMGIGELIGHYTFIKKALNRLYEEIDKGLSLVILIDFPDFNFRVAEYAKKQGIPVFYYIAPQVWAWRAGRAKKMSRFVDKLAVVFDFEEKIFRNAGVNVSFAGHPLLDRTETLISKKQFEEEIGLEKDEILAGIIPGSRKQEIEMLFPVMAQSGEICKKKNLKLRFAVSCAPSIDKDKMKSQLPAALKSSISFFTNRNREIMRYSKAVMVTSGTATLETALEKTPMVVLYKTSNLTYFVIKPFVKLRYFSLVNILSKKQVVPELLQNNATPEHTAKALEKLLYSENVRAEMTEELKTVGTHLGTPGASHRAAVMAIQTGNL